jgi:hypothetical protein
MAVTRRVGNLTIHFLGEDAAQLASMFDDANHRSKTFRRDMDETSRTHRNIYVGSSFADLQDQPDFGNAGFEPESKDLRDKPAFGKAAGAETHFIVVKPAPHGLFHDNRRFDGSRQLALVHELLHPSQNTRELAETGALGNNTEPRTQMREQDIAVELGKVPGKDFPDVRGSEKPYDSLLDRIAPQPNSAPSTETAPVAPIGYFGPVRVQPSLREVRGDFEIPRYAAADVPTAALPSSLVPNLRSDIADSPNDADRQQMRYLSSRFAGMSAPSGLQTAAMTPPLVPLREDFDPRQTAIADRSGGLTGSAPAGSSQPDVPLLGLVSGKPSQCPSIRSSRQSLAFRSRQRPTMKTGLCSCLRREEGGKSDRPYRAAV